VPAVHLPAPVGDQAGGGRRVAADHGASRASHGASASPTPGCESRTRRPGSHAGSRPAPVAAARRQRAVARAKARRTCVPHVRLNGPASATVTILAGRLSIFLTMIVLASRVSHVWSRREENPRRSCHGLSRRRCRCQYSLASRQRAAARLVPLQPARATTGGTEGVARGHRPNTAAPTRDPPGGHDGTQPDGHRSAASHVRSPPSGVDPGPVASACPQTGDASARPVAARAVFGRSRDEPVSPRAAAGRHRLKAVRSRPSQEFRPNHSREARVPA
jgi:hypothetical protein